jgi:hypothetical protein
MQTATATAAEAAPAAPADPSPRQKLAEAIQRHQRCQAIVQRLENAQPDAMDAQIDARRHLEAMQTRLNATKQTDEALVDALLSGNGSTHNPLAVAALQHDVDEAEAVYKAARLTTEACDRQLDATLAQLRFERQRLDEAVAQVVLHSPELAALVDRLDSVRRSARSIEHALRYLDGHGALPRAVTLPVMDGQERDCDPALRDAWSGALAALLTNPSAGLPSLPKVEVPNV